MAAMMGGTMRSPLTGMIFALELTHDFNLLPALLIGCVAAHGVTVLLLRRSILTEKSRGAATTSCANTASILSSDRASAK